MAWGTRFTEDDARARLTLWDDRDMKDIEVLRFTLSARGFAIMASQGLLEAKQHPIRGLRIYDALWPICRCLQTEEVLYAVESVHEPPIDAMKVVS